MTADGLTVDGTANITVGSGDNLTLTKATGAYLVFHDGTQKRAGINSLNTVDGMAFTTGNNSERMRIDSSGRVGIGTSSPSFDLDILDTSTASNTGAGVSIAHTTQPQLRFAQTTGNYRMYLGMRTNDLIISNDSGTEKVRFEQDGNVGIGTSSPSAVLDSRGGVNSTHAVFTGQANRGLAISTTNTLSNDDGVVYNAQTAGSGKHIFQTNGTEHMRIDSDGNVNIYGTDNRPLAITSFATASAGAGWDLDATSNNGVVTVSTGGSERMRIDEDGNVLVGTADSTPWNNSTGTTADNGIALRPDGILSAARIDGTVALFNRTNSDGDIAEFRKDGTTVGSISVTGSTTSYNTSSDYRLKTDAQPMTGATERVQELNPVNFEWIANGSRVDGFLAHEAQEVVPEAVSGERDAMRDEEYEVTPEVLDDDGNVTTEAVMGTRSVPDYQGIDQSKLVPLLTAALQEALTEISSLKSRVEALEG